MRHLHSEFHYRHALFALQGPDGYVDALMEHAREQGAGRCPAIAFRRQKSRGPTDARGASPRAR